MPASRVVVVRGRGVLPAPGEVQAGVLERMYERGLRLLSGQADGASALASLFAPSDRVGIKINAIAAPELTTPPAVTAPLVRLLGRAGLPASGILVWDRTNRELRDAGYRLALEGAGSRVFGTDTAGWGYEDGLLEHREIGSRFSRILTAHLTASISLAILKDHGMAGVTAGMKNYFGAVHNPNKYHDGGCDPYVAHLFDAPPVRSRHRLTILDALLLQFHRGPSFHPRWAERAGALVFSLDPVAADAVGWRMIEALRRAKGLPSLAEENREPRYLRTAARLGLGRMEPAEIELVEEEV